MVLIIFVLFMVVTTELPKLAIDRDIFRILQELLPTRVFQEEEQA